MNRFSSKFVICFKVRGKYSLEFFLKISFTICFPALLGNKPVNLSKKVMPQVQKKLIQLSKKTTNYANIITNCFSPKKILRTGKNSFDIIPRKFHAKIPEFLAQTPKKNYKRKSFEKDFILT